MFVSITKNFKDELHKEMNELSKEMNQLEDELKNKSEQYHNLNNLLSLIEGWEEMSNNNEF